MSVLRVCVHKYIHTCMHAYVHTCVHAFIDAFIRSQLSRKFTKALLGPNYLWGVPIAVPLANHIHTTYTHTYIHTYLLTYIHTHMHIECMPSCVNSSLYTATSSVGHVACLCTLLSYQRKPACLITRMQQHLQMLSFLDCNLHQEVVFIWGSQVEEKLHNILSGILAPTTPVSMRLWSRV